MKKKMKKIKILVRENLIKERNNYLQESFEPLFNIQNDDFFLQEYAKITSKLINEGYSFNEIVNSKINLSEEFSFGSLGALGDAFKNKSAGDYGSMLMGTFGNLIVERVIRYLLVTIGVGKGAAAFISPILARYDVRDLLLPFKDKQSCNAKMPTFMVAVMNGILNYIQNGGEDLPNNYFGISKLDKAFTGKKGMGIYDTGMDIIKDIAPESIRGLFSELFEQSNLDEKLAEKVCNGIWK